MMPEEVANPIDEETTKRTWVRLGLLTLATIVALWLGHRFGWTKELQGDQLKQLVRGAGVWGFGLYVLAFAVGELLHVPGMVFVAAAVALYGKLLGIPLAIIGAVLALSLNFVVIRSIGGKALETFKWSFLQKILAKLEERPVRTVIILRLCLWLAPAVNYALALSPIRFWHFTLGTAIGLILPITGFALFFEQVIKWFGG